MNTLYIKPITEIIKKRKSVRSYSDKVISEDLIEEIENYINNVDNPCNIKVRVRLIKKENYDGVVRLGTYGVIRGAKYFLIAACENKEFSLEALGYTFEKVILYCTSLGLSTVWLGGTFSRSSFRKTINLRENEILPIVSPIGYESYSKSFLQNLIKSNGTRKEFSEIFFENNFNTHFTNNLDEIYKEVLDMVRLAPSSMNSQPWRIIKENENLHIYTSGKSNMNKIDIGIALAHIDMYMKEMGINGEFKKVKYESNKYKYVISWIKS